MKEFVEKLIERLDNQLEEVIGWNHHKVNAYSNSIRIVKQLAEEYMTCYKSCTECEVYDKEKHYCPKFCYIIAETVKEIEENHNGWIPCSERLPQEEEPEGTLCRVVNVVLKNGFVTSGWCNRYLKKWYVLDYCSDYPMPHEYEDIIAWQPLPEQYKPEEKQEEPHTNFYTERSNRVQ